MDPVEEIRARLSIEEVVGQYVQMKQIGRNFKALCPFHDEKTPSFIISPDKGLAYCFGCRKGGDIFSFVQEIENVDFPEALRILGEKAGVRVEKSDPPGAKREGKERAFTLMEVAQAWFVQQLRENQTAQKYVTSRGYERADQQKLGLGLAPDSFHKLTEYLKKQGYREKEILDTGLASQKELGDSNIYDRFRNRIMFPIYDPQGRLVAFGGRTLSNDPGAAKYLNSPETKYYHKGRSLYNFHLAKQSIRDKDQAVVVEGFFDALTAHLKGFTNTVASLGTALTEEQVKLLGRFSKNLLFAFDADQSGQSAASRSIEIAQSLGYNVSIITIPSGKDPDECLRKDPREWSAAVLGAVNAMDYEFQKAFQQADRGTLEGKKVIFQSLLPKIQRLATQVEQEYYLKKLSLELEVSLKSLAAELKKTKRQISFQATEQTAGELPQKVVFSGFDYLVGILFNHPELWESLDKHLNSDYLETESEKMLYKSMANQYNLSGKCMLDKMSPEVRFLELYADERYASFSPLELEQELKDLCLSIRRDYKRRRLQAIRFQLAKESGAPGSEEIMQEYQNLLADQF